MYLCQPELQILLHTLCIVTWKHGFLCVAQHVCSSQSTSGPTPCKETVHASVHVFMSDQLPMLAQPPIDSYMKTWVPMWHCVCQSHAASGHTPWLECVHASVQEFMSR